MTIIRSTLAKSTPIVPQCVCDGCQRTHADDGHPSTWSSWVDEDCWVPNDDDGPHPDGDLDHESNYEPTPAERAEMSEVYGEFDAHRHLNRPGLTLEGLIRYQAGFYRSAFQNSAGDLLASTLTELADRVRFVSASTPAELVMREQMMADDSVDAAEIYRVCRKGEPLSREDAEVGLSLAWARLFS